MVTTLAASMDVGSGGFSPDHQHRPHGHGPHRHHHHGPRRHRSPPRFGRHHHRGGHFGPPQSHGFADPDFAGLMRFSSDPTLAGLLRLENPGLGRGGFHASRRRSPSRGRGGFPASRGLHPGAFHGHGTHHGRHRGSHYHGRHEMRRLHRSLSPECLMHRGPHEGAFGSLHWGHHGPRSFNHDDPRFFRPHFGPHHCHGPHSGGGPSPPRPHTRGSPSPPGPHSGSSPSPPAEFEQGVEQFGQLSLT